MAPIAFSILMLVNVLASFDLINMSQEQDPSRAHQDVCYRNTFLDFNNNQYIVRLSLKRTAGGKVGATLKVNLLFCKKLHT